ncbi:hypothetical protein [Roseivirga misakiensis]|uniref:Hemerythrin-like domain-containing protein n=1 Tax=Roseivirga misakiensis TaxID=1563681 RepID=A0A1E5T029_9BACT|nr:hypothetical protein [Roseivirga misakiensis]OEK04733.1 hypothetical protein BFP71_14900 [Roseivirga misakiensis]
MKRHQSLIPFSKFHRSCLFLALIAKENAPDVKGYPTDLAGKIDYANSFYKQALQEHFAMESKLWNYVSSKSDLLKNIVMDLQIERNKLNDLFFALDQSRSAEILYELGDLFEKHVRKEERVLFQQIQKDLTEEELSEIPKLSA